MRYYLILDKSEQATCVQEVFKGLEDFHCLAVQDALKISFRHLQFTPDLVFINLDVYESALSGIINRITKSFGLMPKLVGITTCYKNGYNALKAGFWEVIGPNMPLRDLIPKLIEFNACGTGGFFCIQSYQDFRYIYLKDLMLLRADNRFTDFILMDGNRISGYNTLKHYASHLPKNFVRIHRSYAVNAYAVRRINYLKKQIQLAGHSERIPFTKHYLENVDRLKSLLSNC